MVPVIRRVGKNLGLLDSSGLRPVPPASRQLEAEGWALLPAVFTAGEVVELTAELDALYLAADPDVRYREADRADFRYELYNRSAAVQTAIAHPRILGVIEPLLGDDCHVIANTAWRNPAEFPGGPWHCDAGPHVPRPPGVPWDDRIPYPVFVIGAHIWLRSVTVADGPTAVIPGSHRSGRLPPRDRSHDPDLDYGGRRAVAPEADAGDVLLFSSDSWHRGTAAGPGGSGRLFIQCHYGRRDIAQRVLTTAAVNHVRPEARARITGEREAALLGLHPPFFYDG
jgi:hypothetical protein